MTAVRALQYQQKVAADFADQKVQDQRGIATEQNPGLKHVQSVAQTPDTKHKKIIKRHSRVSGNRTSGNERSRLFDPQLLELHGIFAGIRTIVPPAPAH